MVVAQGNLQKARKRIGRGPSGSTLCVLISLSKPPAKTVCSRRRPASQHLFPLL